MDADKTKMLFLFWLASKKQKALSNFGQGPKCKPLRMAGKTETSGKAGKPLFKLTSRSEVISG